MKLSRFKPSATVSVAVIALVIGLEAPAMAHQVRVVAAKISGSQIKPDTVTGKQVKESTLGTVPKAATATKATTATTATNAQKLDGTTAAAFAPAGDNVSSGMVTLAEGEQFQPIITVAPTAWSAWCRDDSGSAEIQIQVDTTENATIVMGPDNFNQTSTTVDASAAGNPNFIRALDTSSGIVRNLMTISVVGASGDGWVGTLYYQVTAGASPSCLIDLAAAR
jgi:hypothetical protein